MFRSTAISLAVLALGAPGHVHAHGLLAAPKPTFQEYGGGFSAIIESSTSILTDATGKHFSNDDENAAPFDKAFRATGMSLRDFILKYQDTSEKSESLPVTAACGYSNPRGTPQPLPEKLKWKGEPTKGTTAEFVHPGPCEAWCDDELVMPYTGNCWVDYKDGVVPYAKDKCVGKKQLTFYWLGVDNPQWQVYINCVPLAGAAAPANNSSTVDPKPSTKSPVPAAKTPVPAVKTPVPTKSTPTPTKSTPTPTKSVPTPTTSAPGASGCKIRSATKRR